MKRIGFLQKMDYSWSGVVLIGLRRRRGRRRRHEFGIQRGRITRTEGVTCVTER